MITDEQQDICDKVIKWFNTYNIDHITIGGYAGTGKTFLISQIRKHLNSVNPRLSVGFITYTGKASFALLSRLKEEDAMFKHDTCGTIHSLIYQLELN